LSDELETAIARFRHRARHKFALRHLGVRSAMIDVFASSKICASGIVTNVFSELFVFFDGSRHVIKGFRKQQGTAIPVRALIRRAVYLIQEDRDFVNSSSVRKAAKTWT
jgi:hypothetical protein